MENRYWRDIGLGFIILMVAVVLIVFYYKPDIPSGFNEQRCMAIFNNYSDVSDVRLETIRNGAILDKQGVLTEDNKSISINLRSNRYEGFLESCEMTMITEKPVLTQRPDVILLCNLGDIRMRYDSIDNYIIQEVKIGGNRRADFLKRFMNFTVLPDMDGFGSDIYQTSILYINPELDDVYAEKADSFIDGARMLGCSGDISQDFIELSKYRIVIGK